MVGGGITGLAAAHRMVEARPDGAVRVTLVESEDRLGGKVETGRCGEWTVELGPDGFLNRADEARLLCAAVGLGDQLVPAVTQRAGIWVGGRLRWLPEGQVLGVPLRLGALRRSRLVSTAAVVRAALEPWVPRRADGPDDPLGPILRRRLGREIFERLVDPLLSGIYAGPAESMSLGAVAPQLLEALRTHGSLRTGLRRLVPAAVSAGGPEGRPEPVFLTVGGGLTRLVDRLAAALPAGSVRLGCAATVVEPAAGGGWVVATTTGGLDPADAVIVTAPAFSAAPLIAGVNPAAAGCLRDLPYASVATITLAYPAASVPALPAASGFLVPRGERRRVTACTFLGRKWPHLAADDVCLLRASVGRYGQRGDLDLPDAQLAAEVHLELRRALGLRGAPTAITVRRWPRALPQYLAGHLGRVEALDTALTATPGLLVAGAALRGVGLPACIGEGRRAGERALACPAAG